MCGGVDVLDGKEVEDVDLDDDDCSTGRRPVGTSERLFGQLLAHIPYVLECSHLAAYAERSTERGQINVALNSEADPDGQSVRPEHPVTCGSEGKTDRWMRGYDKNVVGDTTNLSHKK